MRMSTSCMRPFEAIGVPQKPPSSGFHDRLTKAVAVLMLVVTSHIIGVQRIHNAL